MRNVHSYLSRLKLKHLVAGLVLWLLILLAAYLLLTYQIGLRNDDTRQRGIAVTQDLSNQIRLPLLEKDIPGVQALLRQAHKKTDAIYASVSDHGGQIIAYTGAENFIPRTQDRRSAPVQDDVAYLEGLLKSHQKVFRFTADVFFSGTRIGEVVMALSAHDTDHLRGGFQIAAVIGGLLFFLLLLLVRFSIRAGLTGQRGSPPAGSATEQTATRNLSTVICPLCGTHKPFSRDAFRRTKFDRLVNVASPKGTTGIDALVGDDGIDLLALSRREDLGALKRQIIRRCLEIVKKLSD